MKQFLYLTLAVLGMALPAHAEISFGNDIIGGEDYDYVGELSGSTDGLYQFSGQINWGRAYGGALGASFTIPEWTQSVTFTGTVPNNQSATNPQSGSLTLMDYSGFEIQGTIWSLGEATIVLGPGDYALRWSVPAKGQGGSATGSGNGTFSIQLEVIPSWGQYPIADGYVDTGNWLGVIFVAGDWVWSFGLDTWLYLPESRVTGSGAWAYIPK